MTRADSSLQAAYAEADITPPLGGSMPGYFTDRKATGVLDPLKSKVLVLRRGSESVALVACDLIGMGAATVSRVRAEVTSQARERRMVAPFNVWVHCTHTHTGAMVPRTDSFTSDAESIYPQFYPGQPDEAWVAEMIRKTADAVLRATASLADEERLSLHEGRENTLAHYRRFLMKDGRVRTNPGRNNPEVVRAAGEIDPRLHVLRFESNRILMVMYGLHPDCVSGTQFSADYPAYLTESLQESQGKDWRVIYLNACCGNINHINMAEPNQKSGPEEARRIGRALGAAAADSLKRELPLADGPLVVRTRSVPSKLRRPSEAEVQEAEERLRTGKNAFEFNGLFAPAAVILAKTRDREHRAEIGALRLGSFAMATMPGEIFVELGREVEQRSSYPVTRTIGLTNGSMGYIPTRKAYTEGGYEAGYRSARYAPENGHNWADTAIRLLRDAE